MNNKFHKPLGPFSLAILAELVNAKIYNYKNGTNLNEKENFFNYYTSIVSATTLKK